MFARAWLSEIRTRITYSRGLLPVVAGGILGSFVVAFSTKALAITVGMFALFAMLAWPEFAYYLIIAATPVQIEFSQGVTLARVVVPIALFILLLHTIGRRSFLKSPLIWPAGFLGVWFFAATAFSVLYAANGAQAANDLLGVIIYAVLFFVTLAFVRTHAQLRRLLWCLVIIGLIEAVITIAQVQTGFALPGDWRHATIGQIGIAEQGFRAEGTTAHPILLAGFLQIVIPLAIYLAWAEKTRAVKYILLLGVPALLLAWVSTFARSSFLGVLAMTITALILFSKFGRAIGVSALLFTLAVAVIVNVSPGWITAQIDSIDFAQRLFAYADLNSTSTAVQFRAESWAGGWNLFLDNWLLGVGYGQAVHEYMPYLPRWAISASHPEVIHNVFIEIASETGLLGLCPFVGLWIWSFMVLWKGRRDQQTGVLARTLIAILVGQFVFLLITPMVREIWITLAMAACIGMIRDTRYLTQNDSRDYHGVSSQPLRGSGIAD
jgi:O-antigen ligase